MRKVIFKGYSDKCGWVDGDLIHGVCFPDVIIYNTKIETTVEVDPYSVAEFTGRYDKDSRRIFEYDIVEVEPAHYDRKGIEYGVVMMDGSIIMHGFRYMYGLDQRLVKIVGNTYENADLLSPETLRYCKAYGIVKDEEV